MKLKGALELPDDSTEARYWQIVGPALLAVAHA